MLIDIGDTLLSEDGYDLGPGVAALQPIASEAKLLDEINTLVYESHQTEAEEFSLLDWLNRNVESFTCNCDAFEMEHRIWQESVKLSPKVGAKAAMDYLADSGLALGCVSNAIFSARVLEAELSKYGLSSNLEFVISSADFGKRKPSPEIFLHALAQLRITPGDAWYIGDSWENDIQGASDVGMFPIWLSEKQCAAVEPTRQQANSWAGIQEIVSSVLENEV